MLSCVLLLGSLGFVIVFDTCDGNPFGWRCFVDWLLGRLGKTSSEGQRNREVQKPLTLVSLVLRFIFCYWCFVLLFGSFVFVVHDGPHLLG